MKKISLWLVMVMIFSFTKQALCQTRTISKGRVYSNFDDFIQNKLTYQSKHSFSSTKNLAYGYQNTKNENYRFYDNSSYKIVDTASFFIYYQYKEVTKGKGLVKTDEYYFSVKGDDAIIPLTISNLKKSFPEDNKFHYALDEFFKSDNDLLAYDNILNMYKLKYIYRSSCNNGETASIF
jgi:hypothetical protein